MAHIAKYKAASCGHMLAHYRRDASSLGRENIDPTRTEGNYTLGLDDRDGKVRAMDSIEPNWATVEGRIEGVNEAAKAAGKRAVRKDAVRLVEGIVTASPEFFEGASAEEVRDFFEDALGFCREEFGESNLVHFTVHMDEETPHAHFGFVPLRDGKLSWKGFFPDKAALGAMQDRFYGRVGALYGLSRGEKRLEGQPARRHKSVAEYKAESRRVQAELDEKAEGKSTGAYARGILADGLMAIA